MIGLYYYGDATMKQIGAEIGVNESRVSQLHARAVQRLRKALGAECATDAISPAVLSCQNPRRRLRMARAATGESAQTGVLLQYRAPDRDKAKRENVRIEPMRASRAKRAAGL